MNDHDNLSSNESGNLPFSTLLARCQNRRQVLRGGVAAATAFLGATPLGALADGLQGERPGSRNPAQKPLLQFTPVPVAGGGGITPRVSSDYDWQPLIPWGEPLYPGAADTVGIGHDGMKFFALNDASTHGLLAINHEYGDNPVVIGKNTPSSLEDVRWSQYNHGVSVVEIINRALSRGSSERRWVTTNSSGCARRIHANTPVEFSGPVADSDLLWNAANNPPQGTINNCANGYTPWGTYLTCEENFNNYFGATAAWTPTEMDRRYGMSAGSAYGWHLFDPRFDMSNPDYANERNRFGWVVEIDPFDPDQIPVKRSALGRFKHEGIALIEGRGQRVVGYMGDDQANDYIYKFVSDDNWKSMFARGLHPLDHGTLYAARFNEDGSGDWLELSINNPLLAPHFSSQAEVLVYARRAADLLGATPMDRPEWTTVAPNGLVYCTLTNNTARQRPTNANPQAPNPDGHIIRWRDGENHVGLRFEWEVFVIASRTHGSEASFASPDGLWADPDGRIFIETDGSQADGLNDQLLVADIYSGEIRRLLEGVEGGEVTGLTTTPDRRTLFCNIQHPNPGTFPGILSPGRDVTLALTRKDGGIVGS
jgi:secreted PhoX family phosphatase